MYSWPSTSQTRAPLARSTKNGCPPTARKARTGEFTPPGIYLSASAKSCSDWERIMTVLCAKDGRSRGSLAEVRFMQAALLCAHKHSRPHLVALEPALLHLQYILDAVGGGFDGSFIQWFHVVDFQDHAVRIDVRAGERNQCVAHIKRHPFRLTKNKQHAFVFGHLFAKHHSCTDLVQRHCLLCDDLLWAEPKFDGG